VDALVPLLVAAHAFVGALFLGGIVGRWIVLGLAERATTIESMVLLTKVAAPFERLVVVGSMLVFVLGVLVAIAQGRPFLGPAQGSGIDWLFVSVALFLTMLPLVPLVFLPRGRVFDVALEDARMRGMVTPALMAAWRDPVVRAAHVYELAVVSLIFVLMITKPF
jgi:hypothetical protein